MGDLKKSKRGTGRKQPDIRDQSKLTEEQKAPNQNTDIDLWVKSIALQTSINAISFCDFDCNITYVNDAFLNLWGYTSEKKLLGKSILQLCVSDDKVEDVKKAIFEKGNWVGELLAKRKDGSEFFVHLSASLVKNDANEPICIMAFFVDITEQKRAIGALTESEERYKMLFEGAAEGILVVDIKTRKFKFANPAICRMLGYSKSELTKLTIMDIHPKQDLHHVLSEFAVQVQVQVEKALAKNISCFRKDGTVIYVDVNSANILIDGKECNVGFFTDVTERRRAEKELRKAHDELEQRIQQRTADLKKVNEELRKEIKEREGAEKARQQAEERFREIFENALVGIYRTTPDGRILMANPVLVKMTGYRSFEELAKRNLEKEGFEPEYPRSLFKKKVEKEGGVVGMESVWIRTDGTRRYVRESATSVRNEKGKVLYYEGTVEDITEQKKAEKKLLEYQEQLRSLASQLSLSEERMRRRMAMNIHDHMGQNLAISKIKLDSLRRSISSPELVAAVDEIGDLLGQTIESARSLTFELSPPVLYELGFEAAVEWLVRYVRERDGLAAEFTDDGKDKPLDDDVRVLLFQSVRESLLNVTKHAHARKMTVSVCKVGGEIKISIVDDGVGFDVSEARSGEPKASGFGLFSISERLGYIGGCFSIESKSGVGTKVFLAAPLSKEAKYKRGKKK